MASGNFTNLKMQAKYIDEAMLDLNRKLDYPGSIFQPSRVLHTEETLEEIMTENEKVLQSIDEEKEIAEHNIQQLDKFLIEMNKDILCIINEQKNIEEQLKQYGYSPMPETPNTSHEEDRDNGATVDECNDSDAISCEKQLEGLSLG